jgi:hypothetical protein
MDPDSDNPPAPDPRRYVRRDREMLAVAGAIVVLAFLLQVRTDERVALRGLPGYPLPQLCTARAWFGTKCPGCGLTRSFIYLARGDWSASWREHRLGWLLAAAVLLQFPYRLACLARPGHRLPSPRVAQAFGYALIAALIANWFDELLR